MIAPEHAACPGVEGRRRSPSFDDTTTHHAWVNPSTMRGLAHPMQALSMATGSDSIVIGGRGTTHNRGMRSPSCVDPTHVRRRSSHRGRGISWWATGLMIQRKPLRGTYMPTWLFRRLRLSERDYSVSRHELPGRSHFVLTI